MNKINNNDIKLEIKNHEYKLINQPSFNFTSVTTFVGSFFEPFDELKVANQLVNNVPKYFAETPESIMKQWQIAREYGTEVHLEIENWLKGGSDPKDSKSIAAAKWIGAYVSKPNIDTFSEVIVYSKEIAIAGTIDVLMMDKKSGDYVLIDWKTSKKIKTVSYKYKTGNHDATKNIMDCNFYHYSLQMSLYRYILEEFYGLRVRNQVIAHIKDDGVDAHLAPYMKKEILKMLDYRNDFH